MQRNATPLRYQAQRWTGRAVVATVVIWLLMSAGTQSAWAQTATPRATRSATYIVQSGDSWTSVAARLGLTVAELQAANPGSVRASKWLLSGEKLVIPAAAAPAQPTPQPAATATAEPTAQPTPAVAPTAAQTAAPTAAPAVVAGGVLTHVVQAGESWNSIAQKYAVPVRLLQRANPDALRTDEVLFRGVELVIPAADGSGAPAPTAQPATATATTAATAAAAATDASPTAPTAAATPACPEAFSAYPALLETMAAQATDPAVLVDFLRNCQALDEDGLTTGDWTGDGAEDFALVLVDLATDAATPTTDLLLFNRNGDGYKLAYRARAAGQVRLLAAEDFNADGKADILWVDTTCGANTCFDTVNVRSWDGSSWRDWTAGNITMAYADIQLDDFLSSAPGKELQLKGGVFGSIGAGPQRARTELWSSVAGAPFSLYDKVYDASDCLYHKVQDADEALAGYATLGLAPARELYTAAVTDQNLTKCWERAGELEELRSYSLFRLAVIAAYEGQPALAAENVAQLAQAFPKSMFTQLGQSWLASYQADGDIPAACAAATAFAAENPEIYLSLSDYGYANATYTPADLCPVLALTPPTAEELTANGAITPTTAAPIVPASSPTVEPTPAAETAPAAAAAAATALLPGNNGELPACPATLDIYANVLPQVIQVSSADPIIIETWLRLCDGMADDRGGMVLGDFNGDGVQDALFMPTIVSDLGLGPEGRQGAVLLYHGQPDGSYQLVYAPDIFGQPAFVANDDVNGDGRTDLAWTITGCSTFCVSEVQIVTWEPATGEYIPIIDPGAAITEGKARFEALPAGTPGKGKQLILEGGVSGTAEGGLEITHAESWQSIGGRKFRRVAWTYDRTASSGDCLGLRLIEADMALQAADILGYGPAAALYQATLDPSLTACSIYGVPATEELRMLQGLASFRLMQTQAFSGTLDAAAATLAALEQEWPDSPYSQAARQWLDEFGRTADAQAACTKIQPIFDKETVTWQITDHFGINHPALGPEQICFVSGEGDE